MATTNNFPLSFEQFTSGKPESSTVYQWLTDPINQYKFRGWVIGLLYLITRLCKRNGKSYAFIRSIAAMVGKSERTMQRTLRKLTAIGVVVENVEGNQRKYKVNWDLLRTKDISNYINNNKYSKNADDIYNVTPDVTPANFANPIKSIIYPQKHGYTENTRSSNSNITISIISNVKTLNNDLPLSDTTDFNHSQQAPIPTNTPEIEVSREAKETVKVDIPNNLNNQTKLNPIEMEIKEQYENLTGNKFKFKKDGNALAELKEISLQTKNIVLEAFRNVATYLASTKGKIYSLDYILTTAKNLISSKNRPKDNLSPEDRANLYVGGESQRYNAASVAQAATPQAILELQTQQKNMELRDELFNNLDEQSKQELIQDAIEIIKNQTPNVWEKIKPKWPWFDEGLATSYAIDKVKDLLLKEHLEYEEFLANGQI